MPDNHNGPETPVSSNGGDNPPLTRRGLIGGALAGAASLGLSHAQAAESAAAAPAAAVDPHTRIPRTARFNGLNLVVIIADTFRADHLGCYGSTRVKTPHLDRLASQGVMFMNATAEGLPTIPFGQFGAVRNLDWHYFQNIAGPSPGKGPCLYDLRNNPEQTRNVLTQFPQEAKALRDRLQKHLGIDIPPLNV